jgi:uncharacterized protein (DUF924 family)
MHDTEYSQILSFWESIGPEGWFRKDDEIDRKIREKFAELQEKASLGALESWREAPESCLALVILLDQFSRNLYRNNPRAFANDDYALAIASQAIDRAMHLQPDKSMASFFYMPFMHSESIANQQRCVALMHRFGTAESLKYAIIHRDIIKRFRRFPHRNAALGRHTTPAEKRFLDDGGFSG